MDQARIQRLRKIFEQALELPQEQRPAFLDDACGAESDLRAEVERMLAAEPQPERRGGTPTRLPQTRTLDGVGGPNAGERIGRYRLIRELGQGGMGIVYEAEQEVPMRRRVALKIIQHGLEGDKIIARFEAERQALALMDHPNVTRVLDAGTDSSGRPYFVMEYIQGVTLTDYCDRHNLGTRARLELMVQVCQGVQHAHQKGIIHRDIKPSNILVEIREDRPVPRIIDFGVAKATERHLTERQFFTEFGQIIGTPEYMSPEQAEMTGLDVDTRTDVYSLGVVLYELLVGALPIDPSDLRAAGFDEMRRRIREVTPQKPSTRVSGLGLRSGEVARHRSADPAALEKACRGDLDWITMKALEKDRTRRYASASEFAADLERHLANQPVLAGPPSVRYRARKFVRRHRLGMSFAAVVALAIVAGLAGTTYGMIRAMRAERRATLEADTVREVNDFMSKLFQITNPGEALGRTVTAKEMLDRGATRIESEFGKRPDLQGRLMETMGVAYRDLGLYDDSLKLLRGAVDAASKAYGPDSAAGAHAQMRLAGALIKARRQDEAIPELSHALAVQEKVLDPDDPELAATLNNLGNVYRARREYKEALPYMERALAIREKALGPDDLDVAKQLGGVGSVRLVLGDFDGAERDLSRALRIREAKLPPNHPDVAKLLVDLGTLYLEKHDLDRARDASSRALRIEEKVYAADHPELINTLTNLGNIEREAKHFDVSEAYLHRALEIAEKSYPPDDAHTNAVREDLERTLEAKGKGAGAPR